MLICCTRTSKKTGSADENEWMQKSSLKSNKILGNPKELCLPQCTEMLGWQGWTGRDSLRGSERDSGVVKPEIHALRLVNTSTDIWTAVMTR